MEAKRLSIPGEKLAGLYWEKGLTIYKIGKLLNFSARTIHIRMRECGVPLRKPGSPMAEISKVDLYKLYVEKGLSSRKIAKIYRCAYSAIDRKIREYGFPIKTLSAAHITTHREPFSGNLQDKAYLIGFAIGDLRVRKMYKNSETILIDCGSTKLEQISLIKKLFSPYGRIWVSKPNKSGKIQIECSVDESFSFLLRKYGKFPDWTLRKIQLFLSILAGFIDAEGSFYIGRNGKYSGFSIGNYNLIVLKQIRNWLSSFGYKPRLFQGVKKGYTGKDGYSHKEDY